MKAHAEGVGAKMFLKKVSEVGPSHAPAQGGGFEIKTDGGEEFKARAIIVATGAAYKNLQVKGEKEFAGKGVSYCATCDAPFFKAKTVAVVGGGNNALGTAELAADVAKRVIVVHREPLTADAAVVARARKRSNVEFLGDSQVVEIAGSKFVERLRLKNVKTNAESELAVNGVFVNVGLAPATTLCKLLGVKTAENNCVLADEKQRTNVAGVFVAGDCTGRLMQVVWAAAEGAQAALSAFDYLKK
jgi:thioredoxin reductase (NADPH)